MASHVGGSGGPFRFTLGIGRGDFRSDEKSAGRTPEGKFGGRAPEGKSGGHARDGKGGMPKDLSEVFQSREPQSRESQSRFPQSGGRTEGSATQGPASQQRISAGGGRTDMSQPTSEARDKTTNAATVLNTQAPQNAGGGLSDRIGMDGKRT